MAKLNNLIGKQFGRFIVVDKAESKNGKTFWKCKCSCGEIKEVYSYALTSGHIKSCGCHKSEVISNNGKKRTEDLTGKKFGRLVVIERYGYTNGKRKLATWLCQCDCGEMTIRTGKALKDSQNSGCDKCRFFNTDLTGQRIGNLTVISRYSSGKGQVIWECKCDCGNITKISTGRLKSGNVKSCGCAKRKITIERNTTHGLSNTRLYKIWCGMKKRCCNPNSKPYENYGGRGITICDEWINDFTNFIIGL